MPLDQKEKDTRPVNKYKWRRDDVSDELAGMAGTSDIDQTSESSRGRTRQRESSPAVVSSTSNDDLKPEKCMLPNCVQIGCDRFDK